MKRLSLWITMVILSSLPLAAQQSLEVRGMQALYAEGDVTIDGDLSDWDLSGQRLFCRDIASMRDTMSARVAVMHGPKALYVSVEWRDPSPMNNPNAPDSGKGWAGDSLQMRIVSDRLCHITAWYARGEGVPFIEIEYGISAKQPFGDGKVCLAQKKGWELEQGAAMAFQKSGDGRGYVQELRLPWSLVFKDDAKRAGAKLASTFAMAWGTDKLESRLVGNLATNVVRPVQQFWQTPGGWGALRLLPSGHTPPVSIDAAVQEFTSELLVGDNGEVLRYRMLSPKHKAEEAKLPLVLFLDGVGGRGYENTEQLLTAAWQFAVPQRLQTRPCYVVAPLCVPECRWVEVDWGLDKHEMPEEPSLPMRLTFELVDRLVKELAIDSARIYVTGLSMGGLGTWDAIQRRPDFFAAAAPVCGGGDTAQATRISHLPIWAFHGAKDAVVKTQRSRDMIEAIKTAGGNAKYTELPGVGHNAWVAAYTGEDLFTWLFSQHK